MKEESIILVPSCIKYLLANKGNNIKILQSIANVSKVSIQKNHLIMKGNKSSIELLKKKLISLLDDKAIYNKSKNTFDPVFRLFIIIDNENTNIKLKEYKQELIKYKRKKIYIIQRSLDDNNDNNGENNIIDDNLISKFSTFSTSTNNIIKLKNLQEKEDLKVVESIFHKFLNNIEKTSRSRLHATLQIGKQAFNGENEINTLKYHNILNQTSRFFSDISKNHYNYILKLVSEGNMIKSNLSGYKKVKKKISTSLFLTDIVTDEKFILIISNKLNNTNNKNEQIVVPSKDHVNEIPPELEKIIDNKNYYSILGITEKIKKTITNDMIKQKYDMMKLKISNYFNINEIDKIYINKALNVLDIAFDTIIDPEKKKNYDDSLNNPPTEIENSSNNNLNNEEYEIDVNVNCCKIRKHVLRRGFIVFPFISNTTDTIDSMYDFRIILKTNELVVNINEESIIKKMEDLNNNNKSNKETESIQLEGFKNPLKITMIRDNEKIIYMKDNLKILFEKSKNSNELKSIMSISLKINKLKEISNNNEYFDTWKSNLKLLINEGMELKHTLENINKMIP